LSWPALLLASGDEKGVRLWDIRTSSVVKTLSTNAPIASMELSIDGSVVSAASGKDVFFWDAKTLDLIHTYTLPLRAEVLCVAHHPRTRGFLVGSSSDLYAYDFATGKEIAVYKGHHGLVKCVAFNPAGDAFASGSEDATLRLWEWTGELSSGANVQSASVAAGPTPAAASTPAPAEEKKPEKTIFTVKLMKFDAAKKIAVIKEVRALTNLGLVEAKALVESAPKPIKKDMKKDEAEKLVAKLKEVGAECVLE